MSFPDHVQQKINTWLSGNYDDASKAEIRRLQEAGDTEALNDAFYRDLEFGTGGLRGVMGVGSNRMNRYTLGMATQGLCNYLLKSFPGQEIKVAVAHDSRLNSRLFAETAAGIFSANGITVYLFEALRPTPELSYTIRHLGCQSGVVVTASHNPKEYNGYKVYWNDGAQVVAPHDKNIIREVNAIQSVDAVKFEADPSRIHLIGQEIDEAYLSEVQQLSINPAAIRRQHDLKIVYTPLHGTGITMVPKALARFGFDNIHIVQEQATPDGNFPTVKSPNPEEKVAMQMALDQAKQLDADLVIATDPDADRVGIGVKNTQGEWVLVNGNQTAALLTHYLVSARQQAGQLNKEKDYIVYTIVTSDVLGDVARHYGIRSFQTLTGFKYIAGIIRDLEAQNNGQHYIGGGEESYGFMIGSFVRDKDAVSACCLIAEMAAVAKDQGRTLYEEMVQMYRTYGLYKEDLISLTKKGQRGAEEIQEMMAQLRQNPPATLGGSPVVQLLDYQQQVARDLRTGQQTPLDHEKSNVLQFLTADGSKVSARPSGTEPKIKFYFSLKQPDFGNGQSFEQAQAQLDGRIQQIIREMQLA
ncbi:phospho-sugar mutase [Hymenobacter busanensis]|uniref:Phospho-sugar mutase n=1 Tax=Hymenobacter busanensis TaxID=2607656 RepID=A0A7L4ZSS4_9BACT|nr:phospho-sugar mutase [Hymenobacter busanensis]KAA9327150.1 phospho-sugar mutase [Hymenobacter busanensis]QHJ05815.1 phospho-sugar mutase [Hymenobacter busanensis]